MSTDNDDDWDEENEILWDQQTRLAFPYATNNLPRCHPSYRNQEMIQPRGDQTKMQDSSGNMDNALLSGRGVCNFEQLEANARRMDSSKESIVLGGKGGLGVKRNSHSAGKCVEDSVIQVYGDGPTDIEMHEKRNTNETIEVYAKDSSMHHVNKSINARHHLRTYSHSRENEYNFVEVYENENAKFDESGKIPPMKEDREDYHKKLYETVAVHDTSHRSSLPVEVRERRKTQSFTECGDINYKVGESQKTHSPISKFDNITVVNSAKVSLPTHMEVRERPRTHSLTGDRSATAMVRESQKTQSLIIERNNNANENIPNISSPSRTEVRERPMTHSLTGDRSATAMVRESHQTQSLIIKRNKNVNENLTNINLSLGMEVRERPKTHSHTGDRSETGMVRESHQTQSLIMEKNQTTDINTMHAITMSKGNTNNKNNKCLDNNTSDSNSAIFADTKQTAMVSKSKTLDSNVHLNDNLSKNGTGSNNINMTNDTANMVVVNNRSNEEEESSDKQPESKIFLGHPIKSPYKKSFARLEYEKYVEEWNSIPEGEDKPPKMSQWVFFWNLAGKQAADKPMEYDMTNEVDRGLYQIEQTQKKYSHIVEEVRQVCKEKPHMEEDHTDMNFDDIQSLSDNEVPLSYEELGIEAPSVYNPEPVVLPQSDSDSESVSIEESLHQNSSLTDLKKANDDNDKSESNHINPVDASNITEQGGAESDVEVIESPTKVSLNKLRRSVTPDELKWMNETVNVRYTCHVPNGWNEIMKSNKTLEEKTELLKQIDWLPPSLKEEISQHYPSQADVTNDAINHDNVMHQTPFMKKCNAFFGFHREFMNRKQLQKTADLFCSNWNIQVHHQSRCCTCAYGVPINQSSKKPESKSENSEFRRNINCPFVIRYSRVNCKRKVKKDAIHYRVRITGLVSKHTCHMSNSAYRCAQITSKKRNIDLSNLKTAVHYLKINPHLKCRELRPLLKDVLPSETYIDHKYVDNFRRRVALFHAQQPDGYTLTHDQGEILTDKRSIQEHEWKRLEDPIICLNFCKMYKNLMQENSKTWKVLAYLKKCKEQLPRFDYRVQYGKSGKPIGIMYMTSYMRDSLLRYSRIMFLDAQKRQMNKMGWPYIGPVVMNNEYHVQTCSEAIVTSEDIDTYVWLFKAMADIEKLWKMTDVKVIFADGLLTNRLLTDLNIDNSCILHGDYYHLYKQVWMNNENFGMVLFGKIKSELSKMMLSKTRDEWDNAYNQARTKLCEYPDKLELLEGIYDNPTYYSGYVLRNIVGNLNVHGSTMAEINHSSVVAHLGPGGMMSIMDHLTKLLQRQQHLYNKERMVQIKGDVSRGRYKKSKFIGDIALEDVEAKKCLSTYAHSELFQPALNKSEYLTSRYNVEDKTHLIWPTGELATGDNTVTLNVGERCKCSLRINYDCQCAHELVVTKKFNLSHWSARWYNNKTYNNTYHSQHNENNNTADVQYNDRNVILDLTETANANVASLNSTENFDHGNRTGKVSYTELNTLASELCRTVCNDHMKAGETYSYLQKWIEILRSGQDFDIKFIPTSYNMDLNNKDILPSTLGVPNSNRIGKRFKSSMEQNITKTHSSKRDNTKITRLHSSITKDDELHLGPGKKRKDTYGCYLCSLPECARWSCTKLTKYNGTILPKNNDTARQKFGSKLLIPDSGIVELIDTTKDITIFEKFPKKVRAIVVHRKVKTKDNALGTLDVDNVAIEVTLLGEGGDPMKGYKEVLFQSFCVYKWITNSKNSLVAHLL